MLVEEITALGSRKSQLLILIPIFETYHLFDFVDFLNSNLPHKDPHIKTRFFTTRLASTMVLAGAF